MPKPFRLNRSVDSFEIISDGILLTPLADLLRKCWADCHYVPAFPSISQIFSDFPRLMQLWRSFLDIFFRLVWAGGSDRGRFLPNLGCLGPRWAVFCPKRAQDSPKMAPKRPQMAPKWPEPASQRWLKCTKTKSFSTFSACRLFLQQIISAAQKWPHMAPRWPQNGPNLAPRWAPKWPQNRPQTPRAPPDAA